jgi:UDP-glucose 4-epimerase
MRVLVIGGAGYIGSVVTRALLDAGHRVTVADDLSTGHAGAVAPEADLDVLDIMEPGALAPAMDGCQAVLHFAARSLVAESVRHPLEYFRANVAGTLNVLAAMAETGVHRLVFSSTAAVYGEPSQSPITEDAPAVPTNPYGASKLAVDQAIGFHAAASEATGFGAVSLRYFNAGGAAYGVGEAHPVETHLIPLVLATATNDRPAVHVFGTDYPTPDGTAVRDYIHVRDLAQAHVLALDATRQPGHRIYNLGNGTGSSVREVIKTAEAITGLPITTVDAPRRAGDPAVLVASSQRIRDELGWEPRHDLRDIVADAWAWHGRMLSRA